MLGLHVPLARSSYQTLRSTILEHLIGNIISRDVKFIFFSKMNFDCFSYVLDIKLCEINLAHGNRPPKLRDWACRSVTMAMCRCSCAKVVLLMCAVPMRPASAGECSSVASAATVSSCTLNAQCVSMLS